MHMYGHEFYGGNGIVGAQVGFNYATNFYMQQFISIGRFPFICRTDYDES